MKHSPIPVALGLPLVIANERGDIQVRLVEHLRGIKLLCAARSCGAGIEQRP